MGELSVAVGDLSLVDFFIEESIGRGTTLALVLKSLGILVWRRVIFVCILSSMMLVGCFCHRLHLPSYAAMPSVLDC